MEHFMPQATPIIDKAIQVMWWAMAGVVSAIALIVANLY